MADVSQYDFLTNSPRKGALKLQIMTVKFKYDNRDVVTVTEAETPSEAVTAAENFLQEISETDATADYVITEKAEYMDASEDGAYEFRVKIYNK